MTRALLFTFAADVLVQTISIFGGIDETLRIWASSILASALYFALNPQRTTSILFPISLGIFLQVIVSGAVNPITAIFLGSGALIFTLMAYPRGIFESELVFTRGALFVIGYSLIVRAFIASDLNLLEQEAYYWKYAENLSASYFDHPPLVGWSIAAGTAIFGDTEWGVRCMALAWWALAALYVWKLSYFLYDRRSAWGAVALFSVLPYFAGAGFMMSPDSPLLFFWTATLYYSIKLLVTGQSRYWIGVTLALGIGLLAKYPIMLLGMTLFVLLILQKKTRQLVFRWQAFVSLLGILVLFSPVLIWNYEHSWASFVFQGPQRIASDRFFSLHRLLLHILVILTPIGVRDFIYWIREAWLKRLESDYPKAVIVSFLVIPLSVFVFYSFSNEVKINWTGPVFIAILPFFGSRLSGDFLQGRRSWPITVAALLVIIGISMSYFTTGIPGVPYSEKMQRLVGHKILAQEFTRVEDALRHEYGSDIIVVGMDKYNSGSIVGFYRAHFAAERGKPKPDPTVGRHLFGKDSLSYQFWSKPDEFRGKTLLLVSRYENDLNDKVIGKYAHIEGPTTVLTAVRGASKVGRLYYRVVRDYQPSGQAPSS